MTEDNVADVEEDADDVQPICQSVDPDPVEYRLINNII